MCAAVFESDCRNLGRRSWLLKADADIAHKPLLERSGIHARVCHGKHIESVHACREYWQVDCRAQISGARGTGEVASVAKARTASVRKPDAGLAIDWLDFNGRIPSDSVWPEVENLDRRRFALFPFDCERHGRRMNVVA